MSLLQDNQNAKFGEICSVCYKLAFIIAYFVFLILTEHLFHLFSCLTPCLCAFCRNEENKTRIKQFGQQLKKLCKILSWS